MNCDGQVDINEVDFRRVRMGQQAEVVPDAYPDRKYPAQVVKIYPQADRQKGMLVGADAYIIKSGFDQQSLLSLVEKLLLGGKV